MTAKNKRRIQMLFFAVSLFLAPLGRGQNQSIRQKIPLPAGYTRMQYPGGSYSNWIQNLPLKDQPVILDYRGRILQSPFYSVWEVVHMPLLFHSDLEQCADFAMRFWAEYHRSTEQLSRLYLFDYNGRKKNFTGSRQSYTEFLRTAFAGTNSYSIKKGCATVPSEQLRPGDMFVQNRRGGIGHVSVILDVCASGEGKKLFLIGYSFMPAQEFHIEKAGEGYGTAGWFTLEGYFQYLKDFLNYGEPVLKRFDAL